MVRSISLIIYISIWGLSSLSYGQTIGTEIPKELTYAHLNTNTIFAGEQLLYKLYITNANLKLSTYSKMAYVQLIGPRKDIILRQKIRLSNGVGSGDFYIPTELPTGSYKLIAYTNLGLKQAEGNLFLTDISIINPYKPLDAELVSVVEKTEQNNADKGIVNKESNVNIELSSRTVGQREQLQLSLKLLEDTHYGHYSISVKKVDAFNLAQPTRIDQHNTYQTTTNVAEVAQLMPDLRGELISGTLSSNSNDTPVANQSLALLIPEKQFISKMGKTNAEGRFYFNVDAAYQSNTLYLQVLNQDYKEYSFQMDKDPIIDFSAFKFDKLFMDKSLREQLIDRSVKSQIENNYTAVKENEVKIISTPRFFGEDVITYNLDDFKRFPTLSETFVEVVLGVSFKRQGDGYDIKVKASDFTLQSPIKALVLVDGLIVQDHSVLYDFNANNVQSVQVISTKYFYGGNIFQGLVSIDTKNPEDSNLKDILNVSTVERLNPELEKRYYQVSYKDQSSKEHIPDFRTQLFWEPHLNITSSETELEFFTSDEKGLYQIVLEGITHKGEPVRAVSSFTVE